MLSCKIYKIFVKNTFFYRTPPVAASLCTDILLRRLIKHMIKYAFRLFTLCGTAEKYNQRKVAKNYPIHEIKSTWSLSPAKLIPHEKLVPCKINSARKLIKFTVHIADVTFNFIVDIIVYTTIHWRILFSIYKTKLFFKYLNQLHFQCIKYIFIEYIIWSPLFLQ